MSILTNMQNFRESDYENPIGYFSELYTKTWTWRDSPFHYTANVQ